MVLKLLSGNHFHINDPCDLDLCPFDPNNNRDLQLIKGNHPMKFGDSRSNSTPDHWRNAIMTADGRTYGQTMQNNISPHRRGRHH